ncbi:MAG: DUF1616 domain-containing protein [Chloroflexi bacterium]|nr:DUF1616 domain-containing protein [Chloroflexota bacterium]
MIDLLIIVTLSVLLAPVAMWVDGPLRVALGVPFVLFFSGYCLVSALFPRKGVLDGVERVALGFGLSIALIPLIGLVLNYTPWGIKSIPIHVSVFSVIVVLAAIAAWRRWQLPIKERFNPELKEKFSQLTLGWRTGGPWDKLLTVILLVAIVGAIGATVYVTQTSPKGEDFTEFYILGPERKAANYPRNLMVGQEGSVIVGVVNREHDPMDYRVEVTIDGEEVHEINSISLEHKEKWEQNVSFAPFIPGTGQKVEFLLFKSGTAPYSDVHLWIDVEDMPL